MHDHHHHHHDVRTTPNIQTQDLVEIGGVHYYIDRHGELQESIASTTTTTATPIGQNERSSDSATASNNFSLTPELHQAPAYQQIEPGWQYATDYTFCMHELSLKRRRLNCNIASRIPHGRPPDTEHPP